MQSLFPLRPIGALIAASWERFTAHHATYITLALFGGLPSALLAIYTTIENPNGGVEFVLTIVTVIAGIIASASLIHAIADDGAQQWSVYIQKGKASAQRYLVTKLFQGIVVMIGLILLVIPGIILAIQLIAAEWVALIEDMKPTDALKQSRLYVKGRSGDVFWRLIAILVLLMIAVIGSNIILAIAPHAVSAVIASLLISLVIAPFGLCFSFELYSDLKETYRPEAASPASAS